MRQLSAIVLVLALSGACLAQARLGINLAGPCDWNTELPFVDVFRMARPWISQRAGAGWGQGPELSLDEHGWVTELAEGCYAETLLLTIDGGHYPAGVYTVLYDGTGRIELSGDVEVIRREPGRLGVRVSGEGSGLFLRVMETDPDDHVRDIRVIMPGFEDTWQDQPFHPGFLARWRGFACYRFMDWMHTNNSQIAAWDDRPRVEDATWMPRGVPPEVMIDLCNRTGVDPWFCMPHQADDEYVRRFAEQTAELLDPNRRVYIEYSNEVWNGIFSQHRWAGERGLAAGLGENTWDAAWRFYARRSAEIFAIWREAFDDEDRLVCVLATQSANPYVTRQILAVEGAADAADALGVAPYFGPAVNPERAEAMLAMGVEGLLDHIAAETLPAAIEHMRAQQALAAEAGLELIAYEAGQHLLGIGGAENNEQLTALLHEANAHRRMGVLYGEYYDAWAEAEGELMAVFSSVSRWSKWGSWGLMQYYDQSPAGQPKMQATLQWAAQAGQNVMPVE